MIIGLACHDQNEMTNKTMVYLAATATSQLHVVIIDNNSLEPYREEDYTDYPFKVSVITNDHNVGHYYTLKQLYDRYKDDDGLIGLMHNDLWIYEMDWDARMTNYFVKDPYLGAIGLCGTNEIDQAGGRGGGTMCFFRGAIPGEGQKAGRRITDLVPSVAFDSLFMMFRTKCIPLLMDSSDPWEDIPLGHCYDRIWPLRLVEHGLHVATLGIECDHWGGATIGNFNNHNSRYTQDCIDWLTSRDISFINPEEAIYIESENRYLTEYRDKKHLIPCWIDEHYGYHKS